MQKIHELDEKLNTLSSINLVESVEAWSELVERGYTVPAAGQRMREISNFVNDIRKEVDELKNINFDNASDMYHKKEN